MQSSPTKHDCLEIHWSYFHLGPLQGVSISPPVKPDQTIANWTGIAVTIDAIQVRAVTVVVPPGSIKRIGTVSLIIFVIVLILSGKWLIMVIRERVASSS